jgi:hypothetical protein
VTVFIDKDTQIDMRGYTSPMLMRLTGFSGNYNGAQIMPRYQGDIIDLSAPTVTTTNPADGAVDASPYRPITATFSKAMNPESLNETTFTLMGPGGAVSGTVGYEDGTHTANFTPGVGLAPYTHYTSTLTTGITDIYAIPLATEYDWSFTTGAEDLMAPAIIGRDPYPGSWTCCCGRT